MICCDPTDPMDCAERAECPQAGMAGHTSCGTCDEHSLPRHRCGCSFALPAPVYELPAMTAEERRQALAEFEAYFATLGE